MKKVAAFCLAVCLLLSGCAGLFDGSYVSVTPHSGEGNMPVSRIVYAKNYTQLYQVLKDVVHSGATDILISASESYQPAPREDVRQAVETVWAEDPIAAYAVEEMIYEIITNQGQPAVVVAITYAHDRSEIQRIQEVTKPEDVSTILAAELSRYSTGVVLYAKNLSGLDYAQLVEDYGAMYPEVVMETPDVVVNLYPQEGQEQVAELKFTYQHSRDAIRQMQEKVALFFESASLYVSGVTNEREKAARLYALLMESFENFTLETSITPAYSLLLYGVGDSKAFANVYSAMCRQAGLECVTVSGTRQGQARHWNLVKVDGAYYHLDLLACHREGAFRLHTDGQMTGYVWDYSALPASGES